MKPPLRLSPLSKEQLDELQELYRTTKKVRLRTRAQMVLLAAEEGMTAPAIAQIVRESDQTVRNWLKRYQAEGIEGLADAPIPGAPRKVTPEYVRRLVRWSGSVPAAWGCPFPCGPWPGWLITSLRRRVSGWRLRRSGCT